MSRLLSIPAVAAVVALAVLFAPISARAASELLMFESPGCGYCEAWKADIGPIYPKTEEARRLPLRVLDINDSPPEGLVLALPVQFSPTFVVVEDGREIGRIVGYQGDQFFWWYLDALYKKLKPADPEQTAALGR